MAKIDVLENSIGNLDDKVTSLHDDVKARMEIERKKAEKVDTKIETLHKRFVTRMEFAVAKYVVGVILGAIGIAGFIGKIK